MSFEGTPAHEQGERRDLRQLWEIVMELEASLKQFENSGDHRKELQGKIDNLFGVFYHKLTAYQRLIENMRKPKPAEQPEENDLSKIPAREEAEERLAMYLEGEITKQCAPIPAYAGCRTAHILKTPGHPERLAKHFICVNINGSFLMRVLVQIGPDESCIAFDPTSRDLALETYPSGQWTPLPLVIPDKPTKRWEHVEGTKILTAKKVDGKWTTEFYKARVVEPPCNRTGESERGYKVECDGDVFVVPEKYVFQLPDEWA